MNLCGPSIPVAALQYVPLLLLQSNSQGNGVKKDGELQKNDREEEMRATIHQAGFAYYFQICLKFQVVSLLSLYLWLKFLRVFFKLYIKEDLQLASNVQYL